MYRIDSAGSIAGQFTDGNPQAGQEATVLPADWLNSVQEEIAGVIEFAGIALSKPTRTQLRQAIVTLIAGVVGTGGGSVPTTRQVTGAGLVTGGGPLAADLTLTVPKASAAEVLAGTIDNKAVTPLGLSSGFARSLTQPGYAAIPLCGGLMLQWLTGTVGANATAILSFPVAFPTACLGAFVNGGRLDYAAQDNNPFVSGTGTSNVSIFNSADTLVSVNVLALGY